MGSGFEDLLAWGVKSENAQANGEIESVINTNTLKIVMGKPNENRLS